MFVMSCRTANTRRDESNAPRHLNWWDCRVTRTQLLKVWTVSIVVVIWVGMRVRVRVCVCVCMCRWPTVWVARAWREHVATTIDRTYMGVKENMQYEWCERCASHTTNYEILYMRMRAGGAPGRVCVTCEWVWWAVQAQCAGALYRHRTNGVWI